MAKTIDIIVAGIYKGRDELNKAARDIDKLGKGATGTQSSLKELGRGGAIALGAIGVALGAMAGAAKIAWDELARGAQLNRTADQFDRLAESIGSTADSMMGKLREATGGMMTDAALMESAAGIMSLGLAKTEDGVVRLATVVGELGWDMSQVILTMANNSKMRLDALGLSVEDVDRRVAKLRESGMSLDEAFDLAVIEAGEEKIKLLGSAADTTAGQMQTLITKFSNARDAFSAEFAADLAADLTLAADNADAVGAGLENIALALAGLSASGAGAVIEALARVGQKQEMNVLADQIEGLGGNLDDIYDKFAVLNAIGSITPLDDIEGQAATIQELRDELTRLYDLINHQNPELKFLDMAPVKRDVEQVIEVAERAESWFKSFGQGIAKAGQDTEGAFLDLINGVEPLTKSYEDALSGLGALARDNMEIAAEALAELQRQYDEAAAAMSGAFSTALQDGGMPDFGNADAMTQAAFDMATAYGQTAPILADIGVRMGIIDEKTAEAAGKAAIFAGAMEVLSGQLAAGVIDPTQFTTAVEELISNLENNTVVELQVELQAKQQSIDDIQAMDWLPDAAKEGMIKNMGLEITVADEALRETLDLIDGVPDNDEKVVTFTPVAEEVFDVINEITVAIPAIPGAVTFVPEAYQVDQKINELNNTRVTIYVDYVPTGSPTGGGPPVGGGGGGSNAPGVPGAGRNRGGSVSELIREIQREGVSW
jgi:hypothetical protein